MTDIQVLLRNFNSQLLAPLLLWPHELLMISIAEPSTETSRQGNPLTQKTLFLFIHECTPLRKTAITPLPLVAAPPNKIHFTQHMILIQMIYS